MGPCNPHMVARHGCKGRDNLHGFVASRLFPGPVVEQALEALGDAPIDVLIFDLGSAAAPEEAGAPIHVHRSLIGEPLADDEYPDFVAESPIEVADRSWLIRCRPTSEFFADGATGTAPLIFAAGVLITLLAAAYVRIVLRARRRIVQLVEAQCSE